MTVSLGIEGLSAQYGSTKVLENLSLDVGEGELVSLLGASGCGKTTTLRAVAGFLPPSAGRIRLGSRDITDLPAHKREIGLVFQTYALFPHLTVRDNVAFGLKQRGIATTERRRRADEMLDRVGLADLASRRPAALSGGQRQRVALARALVIAPPLLMFDEPLSNLDAKLRVDMRVEIRQLQRANGTTALYVTHDQEEAFSISDRVAIMRAGRIEQLDTPEALYARPATPFVADFVGFENRIPMRVTAEAGDAVRAQAEGGLTFEFVKSQWDVPAREFLFAARPEGLRVTREGAGFNARLGLRTYLGRAYQYRCQTAAGELVANGPLSDPMEPGTAVKLAPVREHCALLKAG
ncbi:MAG: ABC transporter ATP-binding protein [Pseudomonadota bacterium]